jgi:hypothetical protein
MNVTNAGMTRNEEWINEWNEYAASTWTVGWFYLFSINCILEFLTVCRRKYYTGKTALS